MMNITAHPLIKALFVACAAVGLAWLIGSLDKENVPGMGHVSPAALGAALPTSIEGLPEAKLPEVVNLKDGDRYTLVASPVKKEISGKWYRMLAYNGSIPGPVIRAAQGSEVTIVLENRIGMETALHSHGVRLTNRFDGAPPLTQQPVRDKSSFEYKISFPDAGVFWYHPHVREDYQQELGLYGAYVVAPAPGEKWETVQNEEVVFLDDVLVQGETLAPFYEDAATHALMGRFGNVMLVNGEVGPRFAAEQGEIKRFYIVNSANARTFRIAIPGSQMKLVGGDNGRMASEEAVSELTLAPSERAIVDVRFQRTGRFEIRNITPQKTYTLATVMVTEQIALNDDESARFERFAVSPGKAEMEKLVAEYANKPADKRIRMTVAMGMMDGAHGGMMHEHGGGHMMAADASGIEWEDHMPSENAASHSGDVVWKIVDEATKKENMEISWSFRKGSVVKLAVINDASSMHPMQHPFHIHGQKFLVLDINGTPVENQGWKDTVLIPTGATANLLVRMDNPGDWMAHCHIAEHLTSGMMFAFTVR